MGSYYITLNQAKAHLATAASNLTPLQLCKQKPDYGTHGHCTRRRRTIGRF
jgi:hypothetical protein